MIEFDWGGWSDLVGTIRSILLTPRTAPYHNFIFKCLFQCQDYTQNKALFEELLSNFLPHFFLHTHSIFFSFRSFFLWLVTCVSPFAQPLNLHQNTVGLVYFTVSCPFEFCPVVWCPILPILYTQCTVTIPKALPLQLFECKHVILVSGDKVDTHCILSWALLPYLKYLV